MKDLGEAAYVLGIKIYKDRSRFRIDQGKKGFLSVLKGKPLSVTQCPAMAKDIEEMSNIPYASAIGSIMYAMLST